MTTIVGLKSAPRAEGVRVRWGESVCHPGLTVSSEWGTREMSGSGGADQRPSDRKPELRVQQMRLPQRTRGRPWSLSRWGDTSAWLWLEEVDRADL